MKLVDAHVHLSDPQYSVYINVLIDDAKNAEVTALVTNAMDLATSLEAVKLSEKYPYQEIYEKSLS